MSLAASRRRAAVPPSKYVQAFHHLSNTALAAGRMPDEEEAIEDAIAENRRLAWFYLGRLIFAGLLELPNFDNPDSVERLKYALCELVFCVAEDE